MSESVMRPHKGQQEVLDSKARVRVLQWGRKAGKTECLRMAMDSRYKHGHPTVITVDNAEYLDIWSVNALLLLNDAHCHVVVAFTPNSTDDPIMLLKGVAGVEWFVQPSWINEEAYPHAEGEGGKALRERGPARHVASSFRDRGDRPEGGGTEGSRQ